MLKLVKPSREYLPAFLAVVEDYRADQNQFGRGGIDPLIRAIDENRVDEYLKQLDDYEHEETIKPGLVPETRLWLIDGDEFIGSFSIRHRLTPEFNVASHKSPSLSTIISRTHPEPSGIRTKSRRCRSYRYH